MKHCSSKFQTTIDTPWEEIAPGVRRRVMGHDERIMLVGVSFEAGAVGAAHAHPHSQSSWVACGRFEATVNGEIAQLGPGEGFYVEPGVEHSLCCLEAGVVVDAFSPAREDFLK